MRRVGFGDAVDNSLGNADAAAASGDYAGALAGLQAAGNAAVSEDAALSVQANGPKIANLNGQVQAATVTDDASYQAARSLVTQMQSLLALDSSSSGGGGPPPAGGYQITPTGAQAAAAAFAALAGLDYTAQSSCGPVKAAQQAWNANGGLPALTVDGGYGQDSAQAWAAVAAATGGGSVPAGLTSGWPNCSGAAPTPPSPPTPPAPPGPIVPSGGLPMWAKWLIGLVIVAALGTVAYVFYRKRKKGGGGHKAHSPRRRRRRRH